MKIKGIRNNVCLKRVAVLCDTQEKSNAIVEYFQCTPNIGQIGQLFSMSQNPWKPYEENTCFFFNSEHIGVMHKNSVYSTQFVLKKFEEVFEVDEDATTVTETTEEAYKRGLNDMYEAIQTLYFNGNDAKMTGDDYIKCFGYGVPFRAILLKYSAEEIINALKEYFESKVIKPSDEVFCFADAGDEWRENDEHYGVVLDVANNIYTVLMKNGEVVEFEKSVLEKTGRIIPITNILNAIRAK